MTKKKTNTHHNECHVLSTRATAMDRNVGTFKTCQRGFMMTSVKPKQNKANMIIVASSPILCGITWLFSTRRHKPCSATKPALYTMNLVHSLREVAWWFIPYYSQMSPNKQLHVHKWSDGVTCPSSRTIENWIKFKCKTTMQVYLWQHPNPLMRHLPFLRYHVIIFSRRQW